MITRISVSIVDHEIRFIYIDEAESHVEKKISRKSSTRIKEEKNVNESFSFTGIFACI